MEELARLAGITVRTLRFYRERKLIPPPRREGRIAWYDDHHLARLRTISALLERGHTLNGIAELAEAFDNGRDVADLLGLGAPTEETPVRLTPEALADRFGPRSPPRTSPPRWTSATSAPTANRSSTSAAASWTRRRRWSRRASRSSAVLAAGRRVRDHADALAEIFTNVILTHAPGADPARLRPLAQAGGGGGTLDWRWTAGCARTPEAPDRGAAQRS